MLHLTCSGPEAGRVICGAHKNTEVDRYQHYSLTYKLPAAPDLCPDCAAIYQISNGVLLRDLEGLYLVQTDYELREVLDNISLPEDMRGDITAAVLEIGEGEYTRVYLTEAARWYELDAEYYALPFYGVYPIPANYPGYWQLSTYTTEGVLQ